MPATSNRAWWQEAVVYQIYPRSFCDTTGDGVGDLDGVRRTSTTWPGWGSTPCGSRRSSAPRWPTTATTSATTATSTRFRLLADLDRLVAEAHDRGLKVLLDWVPNHTVDQHPWFLASTLGPAAAAPSGPGTSGATAPPTRPPNDWKAAFPPGPAWTWDEGPAVVPHLFLPEQPDLDWTNPAVVEAMHDTLRFWLDRGVDGFRMDVVH